MNSPSLYRKKKRNLIAESWGNMNSFVIMQFIIENGELQMHFVSKPKECLIEKTTFQNAYTILFRRYILLRRDIFLLVYVFCMKGRINKQG